MKRFGLTGLLLAASLRAAGPIGVDPVSVDFGVHPQHQILEAYLTLKNDSGGPLVVASIQGSCDCTTGDIEPKLIDAGGSGRIHLRFNSGEFEGDVERRLIVRTSKGEIQIPVRAAITHYPNWIVNPAGLSLGQIVAGQEAGRLSVRYVGPRVDPAYRPTASASDGSPFVLEPQPVQDGSAVFALKATPPLKPGPVRGFVILHTGDPETPEIWVKVMGYSYAQTPRS